MPELLDTVLLTTKFPDLNLRASGKVRDVYDVGPDHLLFVATDRISAFDYVLATGIPSKGRVLTQMSMFWFDFLRDVVANHVETAEVSAYPEMLQKYSDQLSGPVNAGEARGDVPRRVRRARLSLRLGMEGIPSQWQRLRHPAPCWAARL